jgi:hypothetical protein
VIDYSSLEKPDAPSGTSRELAERLGGIGSPTVGVPVDETLGAREARGATVGTTQVHSLRLPSFSVSTEIVLAARENKKSDRRVLAADRGNGQHMKDLVVTEHLRYGIGTPPDVHDCAGRVKQAAKDDQQEPWELKLEQLREGNCPRPAES